MHGLPVLPRPKHVQRHKNHSSSNPHAKRTKPQPRLDNAERSEIETEQNRKKVRDKIQKVRQDMPTSINALREGGILGIDEGETLGIDERDIEIGSSYR